MSALTEAVELVNQQARAFEAVQKLAAVVRQIGDLEARVEELGHRRDEETRQYDRLREQVAEAEAELAALVSEREQAGVAALEQARVDAAAVVEKAKRDAAAVAAASDAEKAAADEMLKTKGAELKELNRRIDERRVQLGEVEARLAAAQEAVRKMLGGDA